MTAARIQEITDRIAAWENKNKTPAKHPNRFTNQSAQLKKRLEILGARLSNTQSQYKPFWYSDPTDPWTLVVAEYDRVLTDVYNHLEYLILLNTYTHKITKNRGYYSRKKSAIHEALIATYTEDPHQIYTMRDQAWEWFFAQPTTRLPLNNHLFNYLMQLQDAKKAKGS